MNIPEACKAAPLTESVQRVRCQTPFLVVMIMRIKTKTVKSNQQYTFLVRSV